MGANFRLECAHSITTRGLIEGSGSFRSRPVVVVISREMDTLLAMALPMIFVPLGAFIMT